MKLFLSYEIDLRGQVIKVTVGMNEEIKEYLEQKFGSPVRIRSVKELGVGGASKLIGEHELKGFGYGKPYLVEFEKEGGERQEVVISTMKGDGFGHDHFSDRAHILLWQHHAFNKLPNHVKALDVGYFTKNGRLKSAGDAEEYFIVCDKVEGTEYAHDLTRLKEGGRVRDVDKKRVSALASYLADIHAVKKDDPALYVRRIRELVGHSECIFGLTDSYPPGSEFITSEALKAIEKKSIDWRWKL